MIGKNRISNYDSFTMVNQCFNKQGHNVPFCFLGTFDEAYQYCLDIGYKPYQINKTFVKLPTGVSVTGFK